ncbi:GNAT family N-acetyltransferase [Soonwooa sp.]|uniref:GNAT family N-acetyltransferase n=1 Tax=Soonwooa sp. TaxID=1938592 RepID=UPI0028AFF61A|nr:GNAT family N-acetyltransferase [Soonwooa sp.]
MNTRLATSKDLYQVVDIHLNRFQSFFLSSLGKTFLVEFYRAFLKKPGLLLVLEDEGKVVGFAAGSYDNTSFFKKLLKNNLFGFAKAGFVILFSNPLALKRLSSNASKSHKEMLSFAELLSIATISNKKGYGKILLSAFEEILKNDENFELPISLTTDVLNNEKVVQFYKDSGYQIHNEFESYNSRKMYRFIKKTKI